MWYLSSIIHEKIFPPNMLYQNKNYVKNKKKRIKSVNQIFRNPRNKKDKKLRLTKYYEKSYLQITDKRRVSNETRNYFPTELLLAVQLVVENKVNCTKITEFHDVSILPCILVRIVISEIKITVS